MTPPNREVNRRKKKTITDLHEIDFTINVDRSLINDPKSRNDGEQWNGGMTEWWNGVKNPNPEKMESRNGGTVENFPNS